MKKTVIALMLAVGLIFSAAGQASSPMDLVMLLDTSASMGDSYQQTSDYLIGPFLKEFLRIGDTFHLISFSGTPKVEISRRVEGVGDVETIIGRLLLMYPLGPSSDVPGALSFTEKYIASLPGSRHRKVVVVTDGDGGSAAVQTAINDSSARLRGWNSDLQYIKVPITGAPPVSGRPASAAPTPARVPQAPVTQPGTQTPAAQTPAQPAAQPRQPSSTTPTQPSQQAQQTPVQQTPVQQTPSQQQPQQSQQAAQPSAQTQAQTPSQPAAQTQPSSTTPAQPSQETQQMADQQTPAQQQEQTQQAQPSAPSEQASSGDAGTQTTQPAQTPSQKPSAQTSQTQTQTSQAAKTSDTSELPLPLIIGLIILALIILALVIFLVSRNLHSSPNRAMAQASSPTILAAAPAEDNREMMSRYAEKQKGAGGPPLVSPPPKRKPMPRDRPVDQNLDFENGAPLLSLFVEDQNTAIGRRNIHAVKAGYTFTVGGGKSDFLIFLVPVPPHIADVNFDGRQCTFIPQKPQYFPDIGSQQVSNCIGKTIRVISDKDYELHIRIERYQDPLKALNNLLNSINVPGR